MTRSRLPTGLLSALFFVSGFCGLIYESIWSHYLKLFLGHAAYAQSVVLVVFIGGMTLGAWICGRFATRIRNPLLAYAAAELVIGWCAIAFHRAYVGATDWAYGTLLPATCSPDEWCLSSWILAAALILPQSILLGTTFPLMTSAILRKAPQDPGRRIGLLYFLNSFGAVFGVLASAFILIPRVGLPGASMTAGALNVLVAACAWLIARRNGTPAEALRAGHVAVDQGGAGPRLLLWVALLTGLSSFVYEIVWVRMLSLVLGSSTHTFELMLASFILGLALGGAWIRGRIDRMHDPRRFLAAVQILMGLAALATIVFYDASFDAMVWMLRALSRSEDGYILFNVGSSLIAIAIMFAPTFMAGMTLPLITLLLMRTTTGERSIGYVYAWNTFGSIAGVLLAVHVGLPHLGLKYSLAGAAMIDVMLGAILAWPARAAATLRWRAAAFAALAVMLAATASLDIDPRRTASGAFRYERATLPADSSVLYHRDGKTATIDVVREANGALRIQSNGKPDASYQSSADGKPTPDEYTQFLLAGLAIAYRPLAQDIAIIGLGSGISSATMLANPAARRVDTIEIEDAMVEGARLFRPVNEAVFSDPRSRIVREDAKSYFARSTSRYDIVVSEPSNPWVSGVSSLFTREFYGRLRRSIKPEGILVQWIHLYEFSAPLLASVLEAMDTEFRDYVAYQSTSDLIIVATTRDRLGPPTDELFRISGLREMLARYDLRGPYDIERRRVAGRATLARLLPAAPVNSDYAPYVDTRAAAARFMGTRAERIFEMSRFPIPLVDLFERRRWRNQATAPGSPRQVVGAGTAPLPLSDLLPQETAQARPDGTPGGLDDSLRTAHRLLLVECASGQTSADFWDAMVALAIVVNQASPPDRAHAFWLGAARSECITRLSGRYRTWLELFAAVAARDPEGMTRLGTQLLEGGELTSQQREYATLCALAGGLVRGDVQAVGLIVERWIPRLTPAQRNSSVFVALRALAGII